MVIAVIAALTLGFLAGLLSFKVKARWCPHCGSTTLPTPAPMRAQVVAVSDAVPELPRRVYGRNLPPAAYRATGIAKVPDKNNILRLSPVDEHTMKVLLNGLRLWRVSSR